LGDTEPPAILGSDGAGTVSALGEGVTGLFEGDEELINPSLDWGEAEEAAGPDFRILGGRDQGAYAESISTAVAPDLLRRYFMRTEGGYRIDKAVRELCVFARHDVTSDPPFAKLDLVSCRNVLIYLGTSLQRRVIPALHYGLGPDGYLVLGHSESVAGFAELFETVDKKHKVFRRLSPAAAVGLFRFPVLMRDEPARVVDRTALEAAAAAPGSRPTTRSLGCSVDERRQPKCIGPYQRTS
jgi:two-component system CheB/CheR fusion protein